LSNLICLAGATAGVVVVVVVVQPLDTGSQKYSHTHVVAKHLRKLNKHANLCAAFRWVEG